MITSRASARTATARGLAEDTRFDAATPTNGRAWSVLAIADMIKVSIEITRRSQTDSEGTALNADVVVGKSKLGRKCESFGASSRHQHVPRSLIPDTPEAWFGSELWEAPGWAACALSEVSDLSVSN